MTTDFAFNLVREIKFIGFRLASFLIFLQVVKNQKYIYYRQPYIKSALIFHSDNFNVTTLSNYS